MNGVPIKREDIKAGDKVRRTIVFEYTAAEDLHGSTPDGYTYELIERPVVLPTEPGVYLPFIYAGTTMTPNIWLLNARGEWIELPNATGAETKALDFKRVEQSLGTLTYLGTGTIEQQVNR
ncbi:MAG: hypothetical protein H7288_11595 [Kineosporiaceae bacterium]|nr:hypothetical protein [Aeromicrobium sp.]